MDRWFAKLTRKLLQRSAHRNVVAPEKKLKNSAKNWNNDPKPVERRKTADEILGSLGRYCSTISGSGNLDALMRDQTRSELKCLHIERGATSVYVTHDQEEAMTLFDQIAVLRDGHLGQYGSPREVYGRPSWVPRARMRMCSRVVAAAERRRSAKRLLATATSPGGLGPGPCGRASHDKTTGALPVPLAAILRGVGNRHDISRGEVDQPLPSGTLCEVTIVPGAFLVQYQQQTRHGSIPYRLSSGNTLR